MNIFSKFISTILLYRHAVVALSAYVILFVCFHFIPADAVWYRQVMLFVVVVYCIVHVFVMWRLRRSFKNSFDPALYGTIVLFGTSSFVFVSEAWISLFVVVLSAILLFLVTASPRMAQFSFPFVHKGWRRLFVVVWMSVVFFFLSTLYGAYLFLSSFPWFLAVFIGATGLVYASFSVIKLYISLPFRDLRVVYLVLWFLFVQIFSLALLLPFGLFSFGLLLTWYWYLVTVLCRFAVSERGVLWAEQRNYLLVHGALLCCLVMLFLRWT